MSKTEALSNGEKCVKTQYVSELRVKLQNFLKSGNLSTPENLKTAFKISQKTQLGRKPKQFQTTKNQFFVKPAQRFKARLQLALT